MTEISLLKRYNSKNRFKISIFNIFQLNLLGITLLGRENNCLLDGISNTMYGIMPDVRRTLDLRIDYCDERVFQESSYISGAVPLTHTYYTSYEGQHFSVLDHTSNI